MPSDDDRGIGTAERRAVETGRLPANLRRVAPAAGLFFLAPLVAEFLLGNIAIDALPSLIVLAPMYGGGAMLIRESVPRAGRGWPSILLLGLAYGVFEEGLVDQSLFNRDYVGAHLLDATFVPALGIGIWWTLFVLTLHTVWSIAVPIALVEALTPARRATPWLGPIGLVVVAVLFVLGAGAVAAGTYAQSGFVASAPQLVAAAVVVVALIVAAFAVPRWPASLDGRAPNRWLVGGASLAMASLFLGISWPIGAGWLLAAIYLAIDAVTIAAIAIWSRRAGWGLAHVLALAGGALLAYAWHAFPQTPALGSTGAVDLVGNAIFALGAVALLAAVIARQRRDEAGARV